MRLVLYRNLLLASLLSGASLCMAAESMSPSAAFAPLAAPEQGEESRRYSASGESASGEAIRDGARESSTLLSRISDTDPTSSAHVELAQLPLPSKRTTVEETVRRFHKEGLPAARLWQTDSSALMLGLTPKGKPGLWFVKKVR